MPAPHAAITFTPSPAIADALIAAFHDPTLSLADLARTHDTTIEALTLWLTEADTRQRLTTLDAAACWRTRHIANAHLTQAISALLDVIKHNPAGMPALRAATPDTPQPPAPDYTTLDLRAELLQLRRVESARKAAAALIRLTRHRPLSPFAQAIESTPSATTPTPIPAPLPRPPTSACASHTNTDDDIPPHLVEALIALVNQAGAPVTPPPGVATPEREAAPAPQCAPTQPTPFVFPETASTPRPPSHRRASPAANHPRLTFPQRSPTALTLAAGAHFPGGP